MASAFSDIESDISEYSDQECTASDPRLSCIPRTKNSKKCDRSHLSDSNDETQPDSTHISGLQDSDHNRDNNSDVCTVHSTKNTVSSQPSTKHIKSEQSKKPKSKKKKRVDWRKYYKRKTAILVLKCLICTKTFNAHCQWRKHMNTVHHIERPYQCKLCLPENICYSSKAGLNTHIKRDHEKVRNWKCEHCPKAFFEKGIWEQHQRVHDGKRPFQCTECKLTFTQRQTLKQHIKAVHRKEKTYSCSYCTKTFATLAAMKSHMVAIHDDTKYARFQCDICHKRYYDGAGYRRHRGNAHRPIDPIKAKIRRGECIYPGCDRKYSSKHPGESVKYHLVHTHGDRRFAKYECEDCEQLFYDKRKYRLHMKSTHAVQG